jgi:hypothetical protein
MIGSGSSKVVRDQRSMKNRKNGPRYGWRYHERGQILTREGMTHIEQLVRGPLR